MFVYLSVYLCCYVKNLMLGFFEIFRHFSCACVYVYMIWCDVSRADMLIWEREKKHRSRCGLRKIIGIQTIHFNTHGSKVKHASEYAHAHSHISTTHTVHTNTHGTHISPYKCPCHLICQHSAIKQSKHRHKLNNKTKTTDIEREKTTLKAKQVKRNGRRKSEQKTNTLIIFTIGGSFCLLNVCACKH